MSRLQPFRFDLDLDAPPAGLQALPAVQHLAEQAELEARLETVRAQAVAEGRALGEAAGAAAARATLEAQTARLLEAIAAALPRLAAERAADQAAFVAEAGRFIAQALALLLPGLERELSPARLERFLAEALLAAPPGSRLVLELPPEELERARDALARLGPAGCPGPPVELLATPGLAPGAVRVGWGQGGMALQPARLARVILTAAAAAAGLPAPAAATPARPARAARPRAGCQATPPDTSSMELQP